MAFMFLEFVSRHFIEHQILDTHGLAYIHQRHNRYPLSKYFSKNKFQTIYMCPFSDLCLITFTVLISKRTWYKLNKTFKTYHIIDIFSLLLHWHEFYIFIFISFMLFHVPGMIIKMILINPTWIFGVIPGVLKTILAISREVYYFPSPERHFRGQPADLCTTQPAPRCTETGRDSWIWSLWVDTTIPVQWKF